MTRRGGHPLDVPQAIATAARPLRSVDSVPFARGLWLCVTLLVVIMFTVGTPVTFQHLHMPCSVTPCLNWELTAAGIRQLHGADISLDLYAGYMVAIELGTALVWLTISAILIWSTPAQRMALIAGILLVLFRGATFGGVIATLGMESDWQWPVRALELVGQSALVPFFFAFPDGRFVPRRARWAVLVWLLAYLPYLFLFTGIWPRASWAVPVLVLSLTTGLAGPLVAQIYRYRHVSGPSEQQQTKWVVFGLMVLVAAAVGIIALTASMSPQAQTPLKNMIGETAWSVFGLLIPVTIGIFILRFRLWDIDLVINRTLVYGALTGSVVGLYVLLVGGLGRLVQEQGNLLLSLLGAGLVAVLFQPLRRWLQREVNHLMYGERDDPYGVISRLGRRLESTLSPDAVLPTIVETVSQALKLPCVAIALRQGDDFSVVASSGQSPAAAPITLPLLYQGEPVGQLLLAPRSGEASFSPTDRRLLDDLARQAGIACHAVLLTADLQRSRERLVTTREEERRRLRRDLHDGLGPALASLTLKLDAARNLLRQDPEATDSLLRELKGQVQGAIADIRRLVYALRPPTLDELGLVHAIREQAKQYENNGLHIIVEAPEDQPGLPAAVEVAAYRIAQEALTNVVRHAQARTCTVRVDMGDALSLEISDDGYGVNGAQLGVGSSSMRERAEELGGTCVIEAGAHGGTRILARLPITHAPANPGEREGDA